MNAKPFLLISFPFLFISVATTGPSLNCNQSPAYNSQYLVCTAANLAPTKVVERFSCQHNILPYTKRAKFLYKSIVCLRLQGPVYGMNRLPPQQHMNAYKQSTQTPPLQSTPGCMYPQEQVFGPPIRFESPATALLSPYSEEYYGHNVPQPTVNPTLPEPGKPCAVTSTQPTRSTESKAVDPKMSFGSQFTGEPAKVPNFGGVAAVSTTTATTAFKFHPDFKSSDGDFTSSSAQGKNSESLLGLLTSDIPPKAEVPSEPKHQTQDQLPSQSEVFTFGSKTSAGFSFTDGAQNKMSVFGEGHQTEKERETPQPQVSSKAVDLKTLFSKKEGEWDCDVCCVRNAHTSAVCVACNTAAPSTAQIKPVEEPKGSGPVAPPAKQFSFGLSGDSAKNTSSTDVSSKGFTFGSIPVSFKFGSKDAVVTSAGFGAQAEKKTIQADAPQQEKASMAPAVPFGTGFGAQFAKKDGQWDCDSCLVRNDASATECVSCKAPCNTEKRKATSQGGLAAMFGKNDGQWDCDTCLVRNEGSSSHCVSCQTVNPNMKNKTSAAPSSSSFTFSFGSSSSQPAATGFKANFNPGTAFQFSTSKDKASSEGFRFESSKTEENDNSQFEPVPLPDFVEVSTEEENKQDLFSHQSKLSCDDKELCQTPGAKLGVQNTKNLVSPPKCVFESDSVQNFSAANFNPGPAFQFSTSKDKASSEGFRFESSTTEAEKSSGSSSFSFSMSAPVGGFKFGIAESEAKPSDGQSQNGSDLFKNISELHKEKEKEAAPSSSDQFVDADSHDNNPLITGKPITFSFTDSAKSQVSFQSGHKDPTFKGFAGAGEQLFTGIHSGTKADISGDQDDKMYKTEENDNSQFEPVPLPDFVDVSTGEENKQDLFSHQSKLSCDDKELCQTPGAKLGVQNTTNLVSPPKCVFESDSVQNFSAANFNPGPAFQFSTSKDKASSEGFRFESSTTEAEKSSGSSSFSFSMSAPVGGFKFGIAESEAKPSDGQSQNGSDLFKNISELHKEKEKEAAPSSSDQFVDADSHDNNPLITGKPITFSFTDSAKSQVSFQSGHKDPTFKGFAGAGEQLFTGIHSGTKADICSDQDDKMYKTEENDNSQFEPVPLPDFVEVSTEEENKQDLFSHQSKLSCDDKELCQTPGAKLGVQNTKNLVSPPKCVFESDSVQNFSAANFNPGPAFQFSTSKDKASSEGFRFESSTTEAEKSSGSSSFSFSMSAPVGGFKFGIAESEAKPSDGQSQNGSDLFKNISELHKEKEKEAAPSSSDQFVDADSHDNNPLFTGKPITFSFADLAKSQVSFQKDPTFKGFEGAGKKLFAESEAKPSDVQSQNGSASDILKNIAELHKEKEKEAAPSFSGKKLFAEAEAKPSDRQSQNGSDRFKNIAELHKEKEKKAAPSFSGKKPFAEAEAKPSDGQSQNGSASDILKNIAELHKEKEKEAAPTSSDQSVEADSHDNYPLITGKPNTFSFADLAKSQGRFQFGQEDPTFKGFAGAAEQLFSGFHSGPKANISGDQDDKMYKTEENDNSQFEPVPLPDFAEVSTGEEKNQDLFSHQSKLYCDDKELCQTPGAKLGVQNTKNLVSPPKCVFESDSVQNFNAANFNPGPAFQFSTSKDKVSSEGFRFESSTTEAEKSSGSSSFSFSMSAPVGGFKFGIAESEAKPSDGQSQNGSDLFKNIAELHKEKEKEAAPSSSDQSVEADSHDNYPLITGKPNTFSFADLAKSQGRFQFGQEDPTFKGFAGAAEQLFSGFHSGPKANISGDQDDKMYKTEENDNSQFEPVPLPDFAEVSTGEEKNQDLFSHQSKLYCDDKELCQTPGAKLGVQNTKNLVSPPKCVFESDSVQNFNAANFNPGPAFQFSTSKDKASSEGFRFESSTTEAEKSSGSSSFSFSMSAPVGRFQFGIAESEAKPSDGQSQNGSDLFKNISELHKEKEKEAAPSSSDQSVEADSHDNYPLITGKPNTFSFADLAKSQGSFQFGQEDPTFKGFAGAAEQLFSGFHSGPKANISGDQDDKMYKTEENDNIWYEPLPLPDFAEVSTGEEKNQDLFSHQSKLYCDDKELCQTPGHLVSLPKCVFESDSVKKNFGSPLPSKEKCPVIISSSKDEETAVSRLKTSGPAVTSQSSVRTPFSIPTRSKLCSVTHSYK